MEIRDFVKRQVVVALISITVFMVVFSFLGGWSLTGFERHKIAIITAVVAGLVVLIAAFTAGASAGFATVTATFTATATAFVAFVGVALALAIFVAPIIVGAALVALTGATVFIAIVTAIIIVMAFSKNSELVHLPKGKVLATLAIEIATIFGTIIITAFLL